MHDLTSVRDSFEGELRSVSDVQGLDELRINYVGKKGLITEGLKSLSALPPDERKSFGKAVNDLKNHINGRISERMLVLRDEEIKRKVTSGRLDVTLPGKYVPCGSFHPLTLAMNEIVDLFVGMGFSVEEGPEVELDYYNFEALNFPPEHPARDMQDTFFVTDNVILRTHMSPVQVRVMERLKPPLRIIAPGKVYRCDADISHTPMFHQVEGLMVGTDITFSHLKGVLEAFIHGIFTETPVRFRPSFFPFTEPSAEVDMGCIFCSGRGCRVCKGTGWIEILGAGMVNPKVFEMAGYDPDVYTGFAFGMGVERIAMLKYSIDDIRVFFENDLRFVRQF